MFVELLKDHFGQKAGARVDVDQANADFVIAQGTAFGSVVDRSSPRRALPDPFCTRPPKRGGEGARSPPRTAQVELGHVKASSWGGLYAPFGETTHRRFENLHFASQPPPQPVLRDLEVVTGLEVQPEPF